MTEEEMLAVSLIDNVSFGLNDQQSASTEWDMWQILSPYYALRLKFAPFLLRFCRLSFSHVNTLGSEL